jgi:hypothetical protein
MAGQALHLAKVPVLVSCVSGYRKVAQLALEQYLRKLVGGC